MPDEWLADLQAKRTVWRGVSFDSQLESDWAATLTAWGVEWRYHPGTVALRDGTLWEPDFVTDGDVLFECKGWHNDRLWKAEAARAMGLRVVIGRAGDAPVDPDCEFALAEWEPRDWVVGELEWGGVGFMPESESGAAGWRAWPGSAGEFALKMHKAVGDGSA